MRSELIPFEGPRDLASVAAKPPAVFLADPEASKRFWEFFTANIRNRNTRRIRSDSAEPVTARPTGYGWARRRDGEPEDERPAIPVCAAEFHFIRIEYTDLPQHHRGFGYASRDWADSCRYSQ